MSASVLHCAGGCGGLPITAPSSDGISAARALAQVSNEENRMNVGRRIAALTLALSGRHQLRRSRLLMVTAHDEQPVRGVA